MTNQRQAIQKPRTPRQLHRDGAGAVVGLPPVLFSLPNLSEPSESQPQATVYQQPLAPVITSAPKTTSKGNQPADCQVNRQEKSTSLLNAAIGLLALALLFIGLKLYTDRIAEQSRASQRATAVARVVAPDPSLNAPKEPESFNAARERTNFQMPVFPVRKSSANSEAYPSGKAVLEITDPVVHSSYESDSTELESAAIESTHAPIAVSPASSLAFPRSVVRSANASLTAPMKSEASEEMENRLPQVAQPQLSSTQVPSVQPQPQSIPASSLNTRDMILLRQGKSIDLSTRDPRDRETKTVSLPVKSGVDGSIKLTGETYPPVRQRYEPIGLPPASPPVANPTSIQIPDPPKPYQPIGAQFE